MQLFPVFIYELLLLNFLRVFSVKIGAFLAISVKSLLLTLWKVKNSRILQWTP